MESLLNVGGAMKLLSVQLDCESCVHLSGFWADAEVVKYISNGNGFTWQVSNVV